MFGLSRNTNILLLAPWKIFMEHIDCDSGSPVTVGLATKLSRVMLTSKEMCNFMVFKCHTCGKFRFFHRQLLWRMILLIYLTIWKRLR